LGKVLVKWSLKVAQKNLICNNCKKKIKSGHKYYKVMVPMGHSYKYTPVCKKCHLKH